MYPCRRPIYMESSAWIGILVTAACPFSDVGGEVPCLSVNYREAYEHYG